MAYTIHSLQECNEIAASHGGECLSSEYVNSNTRMFWRCANGHEWLSKFSSILEGHWCQKCHLSTLNRPINSPKEPPIPQNELRRIQYLSECKSLANDMGGECLSTKYTTAKDKMQWKCNKGHIWFATSDGIKHGNWCSTCSRQKYKLSILDCINYANKMGGQCLSNEYTDNKTHIEWQCKNGHRWKQCFRDIKRGKWCPKCRFSKMQALLVNICCAILETDVVSSFKGFDWLRTGNKNGKQEIDVWVPKFKLAIEYDGKQHKEAVRFGGISKKIAQKRLEHQKNLDARKNEQIAKHPEDVKYFIRFDYTETIDVDCVLNKLKAAGVL